MKGLFLYFVFFVTCVEHQVVVETASLSELLAAQVARELVPGQTRIDFQVLFSHFCEKFSQAIGAGFYSVTFLPQVHEFFRKF